MTLVPALLAAMIGLTADAGGLENSLACASFLPAHERAALLDCDAGAVTLCQDEFGRPVLPDEKIYIPPEKFFRVHYTYVGRNAVPRPAVAGQVPDYVLKVGAAFDEALLYYRELGFLDPPGDADRGGDAGYDVYLSWLAEGGGVAWTDLSVPSGRPGWADASASYIAINPIQHALVSAIAPEWMGDLLIRQVSFHELHHAVQMGYGWGGESWVFEGMSVMMEQLALSLPRALPLVTDYRYSPRYMHTDVSLLQTDVNRFGYANGLFYSSLLQDEGKSIADYAAYWQAYAESTEWANKDRVDTALRGAGFGDIEGAFRRYSLRMLFLGDDDDGAHFTDGFRYHASRSETHEAAPVASPAVLNAQIEPFGYTVVRFENLAGAVALQKSVLATGEWDWVRQYADCTTSVTSIDALAGAATLPGGAELRAWLVVRNMGNIKRAFPLTLTFSTLPARASQGKVSMLDAPKAVSVGDSFGLIIAEQRSDCRLRDVTENSVWSVEPEGAVEFAAGGRVTILAPGDMTLKAAYEDSVTSITWRVPGAEDRKRQKSQAGGCNTNGGADFGVLAGFVIAVLRSRRR